MKYEVEALAKGYETRRIPLDFTGEAQQKVTVPLVRDGSVAIAPPVEETPPVVAENTGGRDRDRRRNFPRRGSSGGSSASSTSSGSSSSGSSTPPPTGGAKTATLHIGTNKGVEPAEIYIDGVRRGKTPLANIKVAPGRHAVKFRWTDGREVLRRVDVADGGTEFVRAG